MSDHLYVYDDLEWFSLDSLGQIAVLSCGGIACIPLCAKDNVVNMGLCRNYFIRYEKITSYSVIANDFKNVGWGPVECWAEMSERGIFAYDVIFEPPHGYRQITAPAQPKVTADSEINEIVRSGIAIYRYNGVFKSGENIGPDRVYEMMRVEIHK